MNNPYDICNFCKFCTEQEREDCESSQMCSDYENEKALHDAWEEGYKEGAEEVKALKEANHELLKRLKELRLKE